MLIIYFHKLETSSENIFETLKSINELVPENIKQVGLYSEYNVPFTSDIDERIEIKTGSLILFGNTIKMPGLELKIPKHTELFESNFEAFLEISGLDINKDKSTIYSDNNDNHTFALNSGDIPFNELSGLDNSDKLNIVEAFLKKFENRGNRDCRINP